jgi:3-dehydrosphinganine reductase
MSEARFVLLSIPRNCLTAVPQTVLLTGASEGMGRSVAKQLAAKGANVVIVSRNVGKLEEALAEVKVDHLLPPTRYANILSQASAVNPSTQRFQYISADLSEPDSAATVIAEAITWNNGVAPDIVWCMAGSSYPKLFIETSPSKMRQQMDVNYWSCADIAHAILTEWLSPTSSLKGKEKHLVFTSSVAAFYPVAGYAPYAPGKAAIKSLSDSLAQELLLYGEDVKVHTVFPGGIRSPGFENENKTKPGVTHILEESDVVRTTEDVAARSISGLERGQYLVTMDILGAAMRGCAWGGSARNNWIVDTAMTWATSIAWGFIGYDMDGKVRAYRKKHGHPSTYEKKD